MITLTVIKPLLARWAKSTEARGRLADGEFVICLVLMSLGAWFTDAIGLHAVFGAFIMGIAMPRGLVVRSLIERMQPLTVALLLPLFFTFSGLSTQIALLITPLLIFAGATRMKTEVLSISVYLEMNVGNIEAAVAVANRVLREMPDEPDEHRVEWMFRTCLGRGPAPEEAQILQQLLSIQRRSLASDPGRAAMLVGSKSPQKHTVDQAAWTSVARAVLNLDEFITRE